MRKIFYIGMLMFVLVASACQKENIGPNSDNNREIPTWNSQGGCNRNPEGKITVDPGNGGGDGIVDPNGEEEGSDKPGRHTEN